MREQLSQIQKKGEMKYPGFTHVICAVGSKAWNPLYEEIKDTYETYVIGDAKEVAQALEAVAWSI